MKPQLVMLLDALVALGLVMFILRPQLFRLAERMKRSHSSAAAAVPRSLPGPPVNGGSTVKEEPTVHHKGTVDAMLGGASAAASALIDCGHETDDAELVANFIEGMDQCRASFVAYTEAAMAKARAAGTAEEELASVHDAASYAMQTSPSWTNTLFLWRLAHAFKGMASPDVLEAAREVVAAHADYGDGEQLDRSIPGTRALEKAVAKLAAALPKER